MPSEREQIAYAAEVMLDFMGRGAEGKDDDEIVFLQADIDAMAKACGVEDVPEVEPMTAGEVRRILRKGLQDLAAKNK